MGRNKIIYGGNIKNSLLSYIGDKVSDNTINAYLNSLHNIFRVLGSEPSIDPLLNFDRVKRKLIDKDYQLSTLKNKISSIITFLRASKIDDEKLLDNYSGFIDQLTAKIDRKQQTLSKTPTEKKNWATKEELINIKNNLKNQLSTKSFSFSYLHLYEQYIALSIHINYPLRNELCDALITEKRKFNKIISDYPSMNYIIIDTNKKRVKIVLEKYKTVKTFKDITIDVDEYLSKEIINYYGYLKKFKFHHGIENDWFIINKNGSPLSRNNYTYFFQNIFKKFDKKIGTSLVRKIIASSLYNVPEMKRLESVMGHNLSTQLKYYVKE